MLIITYLLLVVEETARGNETKLLYAGPLDNAKAVFGVGKYHLFAEIWEEAGAYALYDIDTAFKTEMPNQEQYENYDLIADLKAFKDVGDASRTAMILQADASVRQKANWFSLEDLMGDKTREEMGVVEGENYDGLMRDLTHVILIFSLFFQISNSILLLGKYPFD